MCSRGRVKYPPCAQVRIGTKHVYDGNEQGESEVPPVHNFMMAVSMCSVFLVAGIVVIAASVHFCHGRCHLIIHETSLAVPISQGLNARRALVLIICVVVCVWQLCFGV